MKFHKALFKAIDYINEGATNPNVAKRYNKERGIDLVQLFDERYSERTTACLADYYFYPTDEENYPVMIYIHGGGFVAGDKSFRRALAAWYAHLGFFVININYSLCEDERFPVTVQECTDALNHLSDIKDEYSLDLDNVFVSGDSAGAYYASMLAAIASNEKAASLYQVKPTVKIKASVLNCGIYDIVTALSNKVPFDLCNRICLDFTGYTTDELKLSDFYNMISPLPFITNDYPNTFLIHAKQDIFCSGQTPKLIEYLTNNNVNYSEYYSKFIFDNHCYSLTWGTHSTKRTLTAVKKFLLDELAK